MKALFVTDRAAIGDDRLSELLTALEAAPGLTVELREPGVCDRECLARAREARERLGPEVPLYVNRRFDLALAAGASGVHLPASGLPLPRVRANVPRGFRVGVSTHSPEEAEQAIESGADLVVIGPIFDTPAKRAYGDPLGPSALARLPRSETHTCEVYAIGGIDEASISRLEPYRDRISGVAGIRLFQNSPDPRAVIEGIARR